jgi:pimeloyl-ACP methyl ester carboxylesterase
MPLALRIPALLLCVVFASALSCGSAPQESGPAEVSIAPPSVLWVKGPAGRLRVDDGGQGGIPVLFVHGLAGSRGVWAGQLSHVRATRRAAAFDLRGHGESDPPADGDYTVAAMAADVAAAADGLGLQRFVLVGHSWAGPICACYAAGHPERVAGILFCDPAGDLSKIPPKEREGFLQQFDKGDAMANIRAFWAQMLKPARPATRDKVMADLSGHGPALFLAAWRGMFGHDTAADLARIPAPMLTVITAQNQEPYSLQKLDSAIEVREVAGVSHWIQLDDAADFNQVLDDFLAGVR